LLIGIYIEWAFVRDGLIATLKCFNNAWMLSLVMLINFVYWTVFLRSTLWNDSIAVTADPDYVLPPGHFKLTTWYWTLWSLWGMLVGGMWPTISTL
jgi:hypothetical protein